MSKYDQGAIYHATAAGAEIRQTSTNFLEDFATKCSITDMTVGCSMNAIEASLLSLPVEVLELLSTFFTAKEWAKGPCLTCSLLSKLLLPSIDLHCLFPKVERTFDLLSRSKFISVPQEAAYEQTVKALRWTAKRFCATTSLKIQLNGRVANAIYGQCTERKMAVLGSRERLILDELLDAIASEDMRSESPAHTILRVSWSSEYWWSLL